ERNTSICNFLIIFLYKKNFNLEGYSEQKCKTHFLHLDKGVDVSVLPQHYATKADSSNELLLLAANGTKIATFGKKRLTLDLNLRLNFTWSFIIANVNQPIIGLDFLKHYKLLFDVKSGCLIDGITELTTQENIQTQIH
ncbi:retrovirus-related Pol polyprotein from transposon 17.6, partial [Trichonephila clavata]